MTPTILQVVLIVSGALFALMAIDAYKRGKMTLIHFVIFGLGGLLVGWSVIDTSVLLKVTKFFGGSTAPTDIIVYLSIIFLVYSYFELLNKTVRADLKLSELVTNIAISQQSSDVIYNWSDTDYYNKSHISINIPAYNESKVIRQTITELYDHGRNNVVVINDGSKDNTLQILQELKHQFPQLVVLDHPLNRGYGGATKTGFIYTLKNYFRQNIHWIITYDADGQMPVENLDNYLKSINTGKYDIILGSRFIQGSKVVDIPLSRRIILRGSRIITGLLNNSRVTDPHNGLRAVSIESLKKFHIPDMGDNMNFSSDFQDECARLKLSHIEIPTKIIYTDYSLQKGQHGGGALRILKDVIYKKVFFR